MHVTASPAHAPDALRFRWTDGLNCEHQYCYFHVSVNRFQLLLPLLLLLLLIIFGLARQLPWVMPTNQMHRASSSLCHEPQNTINIPF